MKMQAKKKKVETRSDKEARGPGGVPGGLLLMPSRRQRLSDELYSQIFDQITSSRLKEGDKLPPETEICRMFNVSRPTVREALLRLKSDGLIVARPGAGTRVSSKPSPRFRTFSSSMDIARYLRGLELRIPVEATAARFAAARRTESQLVQMESSHRELCTNVEKGTFHSDMDLAFHFQVAQATANEFLQESIQRIHLEIGGFVGLNVSLMRTGPKTRADQLVVEHSRILEAIRVQDEETAEIAMRFHLTQARRRLIDRSRDE
jgi:GntR family transcriptional repressor for pyruvate dehydrogenase complex